MIQQISLEQYNLLLNNKVLFQNIKKVNDKLYVSFIGDTSDLQEYSILKNNNYYLPPKYKWVDISYGHHNVILNPNNPNILGYSYDESLKSKSKAIYEYFERFCCFTPPHSALFI